MKNICLVIDPISTSVHLPKALKAYGFKVVGIYTKTVKSELMKQINLLDLDLVIQQSQLAWPEEVNIEKVAYVIPGADSGVYLADYLAGIAKINHSNPHQTSELRRNKYVMIEAVTEAGLASIRQKKCYSPEQTYEFLKVNKIIKAVVKPQEGMGSDQVWICDTVESATNAASQILMNPNIFGDRNDSVLVQEFIEGDEYMIDTISVDGRHRIIAAWESYLGRSQSPTPLHADAIDHTHLIYSALANYAQKILDVLDVKFGAAHIEIKHNPKTSTFYLIELNQRFHGSMSVFFSTMVYGTNQVAELAAAMANPDQYKSTTNIMPTKKKHGRKVYLRSCIEGTVRKDLNSIYENKFESIVDIMSRATVGKSLTKTTSLATSPGTIFLCNENPEILNQDFDKIRETENLAMHSLITETETGYEFILQ
ncbi:ATP-grasp domain-containing protein [Pseudomonas corrugata]|uniref:ATP-grasp domain-containing protein n=1 Tax=Pseudomonas corrugata TaxID=47879 RepID=UPI0028C3D562|nr:ATP-grasp domain-containing protein [Pseudomonas corrugata]MDU9037062.1 ATP-grasp domain-containing protein [Pseudomonas corrugata]